MSFDPESVLLPGSLFGLPNTPEDAALVCIPVPIDATSSYSRGSAHAYRAIKNASLQLDLYDRIFGEPYRHGIAMLEPEPSWLEDNQTLRTWIDTQRSEPSNQHLARINNKLGDVHKSIQATCRYWLERGKYIGLIGGDHSTSLSLIQLLSERESNLGILHIDAHHDLRVAYEGIEHSHASIMHNVLKTTDVHRIVSVGIRDFSKTEFEYAQREHRVDTLYADDIHRTLLRGDTIEKVLKPIWKQLPQQLYISFDIDGLDPSYCPRTGTPVPGGLSFAWVRYLFEQLQQRGHDIVGFDLVETGNKNVDTSSTAPHAFDEYDANVAARLLYMMCGLTLKTNPYS